MATLHGMFSSVTKRLGISILSGSHPVYSGTVGKGCGECKLRILAPSIIRERDHLPVARIGVLYVHIRNVQLELMPLLCNLSKKTQDARSTRRYH